MGTVKSRLFRGRRQLQKVLYDYALEMGNIRPRALKERLRTLLDEADRG